MNTLCEYIIFWGQSSFQGGPIDRIARLLSSQGTRQLLSKWCPLYALFWQSEQLLYEN